MEKNRLVLMFYGDLPDLVTRPLQEENRIDYPLNRRAAIKDIIEAVGIPHTEVGRIVRDGCDLNFQFIPAGGERIEIHPFANGTAVTKPTLLRPEPIAGLKFLVDSTVAKLGRYLRIAGCDTASVCAAEIVDIARLAIEQRRIILSRNRELLKIRTVTFGRLLRSGDPLRQLAEVVQLYGLQDCGRPFSRCLHCNTVLRPVEKAAILDRLEPLTKKYYTDFKQCEMCARIYWRGSHHERMSVMIGTAITSPEGAGRSAEDRNEQG